MGVQNIGCAVLRIVREDRRRFNYSDSISSSRTCVQVCFYVRISDVTCAVTGCTVWGIDTLPLEVLSKMCVFLMTASHSES